MKRDVVAFRESPAVVAIADDRGDFDRQFRHLGAPENFIEAVIGFGHQHGGAHAVWQSAEMPRRFHAATESAESLDKIGKLHIQRAGVNFQSGEEFSAKRIGKLCELDQVALVSRDVARDLRNNPRLIRTVQLQYQSLGCARHGALTNMIGSDSLFSLIKCKRKVQHLGACRVGYAGYVAVPCQTFIDVHSSNWGRRPLHCRELYPQRKKQRSLLCRI